MKRRECEHGDQYLRVAEGWVGAKFFRIVRCALCPWWP